MSAALDIWNALERLTAAAGPSGFEGPVAQVARELLSPYVDETWLDRMGNLVGVRRCGREGAKKLLLDAHLDEIGLMVTGHEDGFLRFTAVGGVDPRMLPDREVTVLADPPLFGVITCQPPHLQSRGEGEKAVAMDKLYIDVGLTQAQAEARVPVGTPAVYRGGCFPLGEKRLCGKSLDDRSCFAALLLCAEQLREAALDVDVYFLGSTREEVSGAGARCGAFALEPDFCVAVDVTHGRTPDLRNPEDRAFALGGGPAIGVGPNMTGWMTKRLRDKAEALGLPYQLEVMAGDTGTNAWGMQISREGIATAILSLPLRYMHTPVEVLDREDLERVGRLLAAFAQDLEKEAGGC